MLGGAMALIVITSFAIWPNAADARRVTRSVSQNFQRLAAKPMTHSGQSLVV